MIILWVDGWENSWCQILKEMPVSRGISWQWVQFYQGPDISKWQWKPYYRKIMKFYSFRIWEKRSILCYRMYKTRHTGKGHVCLIRWLLKTPCARTWRTCLFDVISKCFSVFSFEQREIDDIQRILFQNSLTFYDHPHKIPLTGRRWKRKYGTLKIGCKEHKEQGNSFRNKEPWRMGYLCTNYMSTKSWPILYFILLYKMDQDSLDMHYSTQSYGSCSLTPYGYLINCIHRKSSTRM